MRRLNRLAGQLTSAHLVAWLALFIALGGSAFAVTQIPRNSIGPQQLKRGAVQAQHIRGGAVNRHKIAPRAINNTRIAAGAVNSPKIANGSINRNKIRPGAVDSSRLAAGAVGAEAIQPGAVQSGALAAGSVGTGHLANNSVSRAKIAEGSLPMLAPLRSGQTLRGMFALTANGDSSASPTDSVRATDAQTFEFPMLHAPTLQVIDTTVVTPAYTAECPGIAGGNQQTPQAAAGNLCLYLRHIDSVDGEEHPEVAATASASLSITRLGFGLTATFGPGGGTVVGMWAATAA